MLPRQRSKPSLAAWLCSYNPNARLDLLARTLAGDNDLLLALESLRTKVDTTDQDGHAELDEARRKVDTLRSSLNSLTTHMTHLTDRLAASEAALASANLQADRKSSQHAEDVASLRALCTVWEGRWREEQRLREEAEGQLAQNAEGRGLNTGEARRITTVRLTAALTPCRTHDRRESDSPTSSEAQCNPSSRRSSAIASPSRREKLKMQSRALIAQLTHDLRTSSHEHALALAGKDDQIASLTADLAVRRDELSSLYASLDSLLSMRGSRASLEGAIALADPPATSPPSHASRDDETLKLEEEVRALEREIARLDGSAGSVVKNNGSTPSVAPTSGPVQDEAKDGSVDQQAHQFIERLERQLVLTETRLKKADNERSQLRRLLEEHGAHPTSNTPTIAHPTRNTPALELMEQVQRAEAERDRLAALLATAEAESQSLQAQLVATHQSLDTLSARVRRKLFEQKTRLDEAQQRIAMLSDELWRSEREKEHLTEWIRRSSGERSRSRRHRQGTAGDSPEGGSGGAISVD